MRRRSFIAAPLLALALPLTACGGSDAPKAAGGTCEKPSAAADGTPAPMKIVSISPSATEMLFAIGACNQVIAVDDQSNYPASAPKTALSGFEPNVEAIAGYEPDLVVMADDYTGLVDAFAKLDIEALSLPAAKTIDDSYAQIVQLGDVTGHQKQATKVVESMKTRIADVLKKLPKDTAGMTYYHELDNTYFSVTSTTFIGQVYSMLGLKNIADSADPDGTGYPQLSAEYIVESNPALIFLADTKCCQQTPETVAARPGWEAIAAVTDKRVIALDDDIASRWGPRIVDLLEQVAAALK